MLIVPSTWRTRTEVGPTTHACAATAWASATAPRTASATTTPRRAAARARVAALQEPVVFDRTQYDAVIATAATAVLALPYDNPGLCDHEHRRSWWRR